MNKLLLSPQGCFGKPGLIFMKRAILFIDSSNVYHALKKGEMFEYFSYSWLFGELSKEFEITKTYFYDAIKNEKIEPNGFRKQQQFHAKIEKEIPNLVVRHRKLKYNNVIKRAKEAEEKCEFCKDCKIKVPTFLKGAGLNKMSREKGIDVMLVIDMIKGAFQEKYDVALVVTGDADFVPAVELVKTLKKEVINIHFYAGSSSELRQACDSHILIGKDAKDKCFLSK